MSIVGFQDFWVAGSRFYFKRDNIGATIQPWIDLGVLQSVSPAFTIEKLELEDTDGGVKRTVDEALTKIDETYDITCSNLNIDNLSLIFLSTPATDFQQTVAEKIAVSHWCHPGRLVMVRDNDSDSTKIYQINVAGIVNPSVATSVTEITTLTDIDKDSRTFTFSSDPGFTAGDRFILMSTGLTNGETAGTYQVESQSGSAPDVEVVVTAGTGANIAADESSLSGTSVYIDNANSDTGFYLENVDWAVKSEDRGILQMISEDDGGAFTTARALNIYYTTRAIADGARRLTPQSASEVQGEGILIVSRGNNANQTSREIPSLSLTPTSLDINADNFSSFVIQAKVLADTTLGESSGRMLYFKGNPTDLS